MAGRTPLLFVFDLDNCVWYPEMYQLWGSSGPPFVRNEDNTCNGFGGTGGKVRAPRCTSAHCCRRAREGNEFLSYACSGLQQLATAAGGRAW